MVGEAKKGAETKKGKTFGLGCEPVVGSLAPAKKRDYKITNRLQEGNRPIYAVVFNFLDSRYFNVFATASGNRVRPLFFSPPPFFFSIRKFQFLMFLFSSSYSLDYCLSMP